MMQRFETWGIEAVVRHRWAWPVFLAALLLPAIWGAGRLTMDSSNESFIPVGDPVTLANDEFKAVFGSEEFIYVLVESEDPYSVESLERLRDLHRDLEENLPFVDEVTSVYNAETMESSNLVLDIRSMEDVGIPSDPAERAAMKCQHLDSLIFRDRLVSRDGTSMGIFISLREMPERAYALCEPGYSPFKDRYWTREAAVLASDIADEPGETGHWQLLSDPRKDTAATLRVLVDAHRRDDFRLTVTGLPVIDYSVDLLTGRESGFFGLLALATAAILLILLFRDIRALLAPLAVFAGTTAYLFGMMGIVGMRLSIMTIVLVPLLLVISVSYSVHMVNQIKTALDRGADRRKALARAYGNSAWPCFLTAVTTAAGFVSFLFVPMKPFRELGLQCAAGTMTAFVLAMVVVPLAYLPGKSRPARVGTAHRTPELWRRWNAGLSKRGGAVAAVIAVVAVAAIAGALRIKASSDMLEIIGDSVDFVRDTQYVSERLGGAYSAEFLIELPEPGQAGDPAVLTTLVEAAARAEAYDEVSLTLSLADLILELDRVFMGKDADRAAIPERSDIVAQYMLLYESSGGTVLDEWTDLEYRTLRLSVLFGGSRTNFTDLGADVGGFLRSELPAGTSVSLTGDLPALVRMMDLLIQSQIRSCLAALAFIALLLILILRSWRLGGLAVLPNLFPILTTLGLMGWLGMALDFVTAMVAPMLIGIAVDDTVHFFVHYRSARGGSSGPEEASERTFRSVGNALVFTSVVLAGGFALFVFSRMQSLRNLGILAASGIVSALLADLCLSPLLLKQFDRKHFQEEQKWINDVSASSP